MTGTPAAHCRRGLTGGWGVQRYPHNAAQNDAHDVLIILRYVSRRNFLNSNIPGALAGGVSIRVVIVRRASLDWPVREPLSEGRRGSNNHPRVQTFFCPPLGSLS